MSPPQKKKTKEKWLGKDNWGKRQTKTMEDMKI